MLINFVHLFDFFAANLSGKVGEFFVSKLATVYWMNINKLSNKKFKLNSKVSAKEPTINKKNNEMKNQ